MEIIAKAAEDKVFKVYQASIKALRTLLAFANFTTDLNYVWTTMRPIINSILLKCADRRQKRMSDLSLETISELCFGQHFQLGNRGQNQRYVPFLMHTCLLYLDVFVDHSMEWIMSSKSW